MTKILYDFYIKYGLEFPNYVIAIISTLLNYWGYTIDHGGSEYVYNLNLLFRMKKNVSNIVLFDYFFLNIYSEGRTASAAPGHWPT